jgi:hypothetical protein
VSPARKTAATVMLALLGIVLAAGITWGTSQLVRQRIGLASEPLTAGQHLLPRSLAIATATPSPRKKALAKTTTTVTTTVPAPAPPATTTVAPAPPPAPTSTAPVERGSTSRGERSDSTDSAGRDD